MNPDWDFRCLDADAIGLYLDVHDLIDLEHQTVTSASLSDIIRIALLHEFGGVWVDATLFCNQPLDEWLPFSAATGFFAFSNPAPDRLLASWFLATANDNCLVAKWAAETYRYWQGRHSSDDYFWFHHLFGKLYNLDDKARAAWDLVPKISAGGPHSLQFNLSAGKCKIDLSAPVYKLSHRIDPMGIEPGAPLYRLFHANSSWKAKSEGCQDANEMPCPQVHGQPMRFVGLKVSTENLGDHIQILAADRLLSRVGINTEFRVDRDSEIASASSLDALAGPVGMLVNGWFKTNSVEWPPHPNICPIYIGFHIRLFQSPSLVGEKALEHYKRHGPIGCRDNYTLALLNSHNVEAFHSNCLTILLPKRLPNPDRHKEIFVVSRDERIMGYLPAYLKPVTFIKHYSGSFDFDTNISIARELLEKYQKRARIIVTTLLHCALPAIAMGIPVIVFVPLTKSLSMNRTRNGSPLSQE